MRISSQTNATICMKSELINIKRIPSVLISLIYRIQMSNKTGCYRLCQKTSKTALPVEKDFNIINPLLHMQQGLPAPLDYSDYISVIGFPVIGFTPSIHLPLLKADIAKLVIDNTNKSYDETGKLRQLDQLLICAFDTKVWNESAPNSQVNVYDPIWADESRADEWAALGVPDFARRKRDFYKFDIKIFFQVKKLVKGADPLTEKVVKVLQKYGFVNNNNYFIVEGQSREFCGVQNAIIAGRFNDGVEKPKDPFTFYLECLIGYDNAKHLGGSYVIAQQCQLDWKSIHTNSESLPGTIGRNDIKNGSTIFSQHHCPRSHIRLSRIKDQNGNPITLHRESKTYTTSKFDPLATRGVTDNINPEQGLFFVGYHKDKYILEKIILNQLGLNHSTGYTDGLLNHMRVNHGNILYVPSMLEITGMILERVAANPGVDSLSKYHQIKWLKHYRRNDEDEQEYRETKNSYFLNSRAGYLKKMSFAHETPEMVAKLNPPSPRILRLICRTFALWQDTWYYDRRQIELDHLSVFLDRNPAAITKLSQETGFDFTPYYTVVDGNTVWSIEKIPISIRSGLAIYFNLGHGLSTKEYGCRGPVNGDDRNPFGANTFHLEPEDLLAGGEANLTFGQGKHLIDYLTEAEKQNNWLHGLNLSAHSGIGHVVAYVTQIFDIGLAALTKSFQDCANGVKNLADKKKYNLFMATVLSLHGLKQYFINYADLAKSHAAKCGEQQLASKNSFLKIEATMRKLSTDKPSNLHEGAQLALSIFITLHITGEPISLGRLDHELDRFATKLDATAKTINIPQEEQDIIDCFWIKVGEKANFNKGFFEDHQKWGNLAMGGNSAPYPQGASFNQWGHQLTVGGTNVDGSPFYNSVTVACLRAARTIPVNAPCLGLRLDPNSPAYLVEEAAKAIMSGGAHPILLNQAKILAGLRQSGNYVIPKELWDKTEIKDSCGQVINVPYTNWKTEIAPQHLVDYTSDGCHEFLIAGRSWFWLGGGNALEGLEYVLNVGKSLLQSGPRYIHGMRNTYRDRPLSSYKTYEDLENEYFSVFEELMRKGFNFELSGFGNLSTVCPASLLNAFTANMRERASDFYENGAEYKIFCPQYTGLANLANSLYNIKTLVFDKKVTTLEEIRNVLLVNWGDELQEPFVPRTLPNIMKTRLKQRCDMLREVVWRQNRFGTNKETSEFGLRISRRLCDITRNIFSHPNQQMLSLFKNLTHTYGSAEHPFGFQYLPGCGTFENFEDFGIDRGASFDGRKKSQTLAQDYSPQNFLIDKQIGDPKFEWKAPNFEQVLYNYTYAPLSPNDPLLSSGAVCDFNIDESYPEDKLTYAVDRFAKGYGPNLITITVCSRKKIEEARTNTDRDLLRFRMGGWTEFAVAMFPSLLEQHIRRLRSVPDLIHADPLPYPIPAIKSKQEEYHEPQPSKKVKR